MSRTSVRMDYKTVIEESLMDSVQNVQSIQQTAGKKLQASYNC